MQPAQRFDWYLCWGRVGWELVFLTFEDFVNVLKIQCVIDLSRASAAHKTQCERYHVTFAGYAGPHNFKSTDEFRRKNICVCAIFVNIITGPTSVILKITSRKNILSFDSLGWRETNSLLSHLRTNIKSISNLTKINIGSALIFKEILGIWEYFLTLQT